jgi:hypothetical protein
MLTAAERARRAARRPHDDAAGLSSAAVADVSVPPAEFQHRPRCRRKRRGAERRAAASAAGVVKAQKVAGTAAALHSCRKAGCSGTAAPTRCSSRRSGRC